METVPAKTIVTRAKSSSWFGMDYNMNIYRGCSHGCIYCDSRSACYRDDTFHRVKAKENALAVIRDDLRRKVRKGVVATGAMSDPYNPLEKQCQLTRHALELLGAYGFGVAIATKGDLVLRDVDILREIQEHAPVLVKITVTTCDDGLAKVIEPGAPSPTRRWEVVEALSQAGIFCGILLMPVLPFLTDSPDSVREVVDTAARRGARFVYPGLGVTMRDRQREYFYSRLDESFPRLSPRYRRQFGDRYQCPPPHVRELWKQFQEDCRRTGMLYRMPDIVSGYKMGYGSGQLTFWA